MPIDFPKFLSKVQQILRHLKNKGLKLYHISYLKWGLISEVEETQKYTNQQLTNIIANKLAQKSLEIEKEKNNKKLETQGELQKIEKMRSFILSIRNKFHSKQKPKLQSNQNLYPRISYNQSKLYLVNSQANLQFQQYDGKIYQFEEEKQGEIQKEDNQQKIYQFDIENPPQNNEININLNEQHKNQNQSINEQTNQANQLQECTICLEDKKKEQIMKICNHHEFCFDCISEYYSYKIENGNVLFIKCIKEGCPLEAKQEDIELYVSPLLFKRYLRLRNQKKNEEDPNLYQCPEINCNGFCSKNDGLCTICFEYSCAICYQKLHPGVSCDNVPDKEMEQAILDYKIAPCPSCQALIQKNNGCNHITCTNCKYQFCWLCGKQYVQGHFSRGFKQCQQFKDGAPYNQKQNILNFDKNYNDDEEIQQYNQYQRGSCMNRFYDRLEQNYPCFLAICSVLLFPITLCLAWMGVMYAILKPADLDDFSCCLKYFLKTVILLIGLVSFPVVWLGSAVLLGLIIGIIIMGELDASFEVAFYISCVVIPVILLVVSIVYSVQAVYNYDTFVQRVVRALQKPKNDVYQVHNLKVLPKYTGF
ncbi:hypothetical protein PPERSA_07115 [Pseudocohnilembus persalinus]|uniref:RBR-type E3 ubiquitin transferase n=1 Tax=Pseudocohnilembus persalinus TaxID=266149 RepID=A0A0V0QYI6_PSEPJ|nr:hypothetical protein PPERSA_07115 [Pseudocohnilembus persalinus]|eukprot:KRX06952.1 hypothetical protein PPERSA_07115 [Pseudocohnilembus persalinus]